MGEVNKSDKEQPDRAETSVPGRFTIQSLAALDDVLRQFEDEDFSAETPKGSPESPDPRSDNPGGQ